MYLNVHSYYSLRYGTLSIEEIISDAKEKGVNALALTDINNVTGIFDFVKLCKKENIKPIAGIDFRNNDKQLYIALAKNNDGFTEINEWLTAHNLYGTSLENPQFDNAFVIYPFGTKSAHRLLDNEFIGVRHTDLNFIISTTKAERSKMVMLFPVTFKDKTGYYLHRHLRAIDHNILLSKLMPGMTAKADEIMLPEKMIIDLYGRFPDIISNTRKIIESCSFDFDFGTHKNKSTYTGNTYEDKLLLQKIAYEGLIERYGNNNKIAAQRLLKEIEIIDKLQFSAYFLIAWDIVCYSMSQGFYHVGRGSGANSIVAYCLKITDVDPIELDLYFERFLNPKRSSPPDFDIDFSWKERDVVLKYIFDKYGTKHTALLGTVPVFKHNSIIRELSKVYGLPKEETDSFLDNPKDEINKNHIFQRILKLSSLMYGFPNIRSIHAGGVLISENPITAYTALDLPPKGFPTVQWDMYVAEDIGFEKFDILSQRGIGHIKDSLDIIRQNKSINVDIHKISEFKQDSKVIELLKKGETIGCFYIESPAMRGLLKKLKCNNYLSLVAASSIIRPGVARSGMMKEYIKRFNNPSNIKYIHPVMREHLAETFGIMVYQEDVLKVCHHFAGLDLADADVLRRAMSGKFRSQNEFEKIKDKFFEKCRQKGHDINLTKEVWRQIESFAGYSFSKAHSASYAAESFQSLYLKTYFPLEFITAVINNFGGFYRTWVYLNEAVRLGASVELPCINKGQYLTSIKGNTIYIGFVHVENLEQKKIKQILKNRDNYGEFADLQDLLQRVHVGLEQIIILIRVGALRFTGKTKPQLLWEAHFLLKKCHAVEGQSKLFSFPAKKFTLPVNNSSKLEDAYDELELIGVPVSLSWFDLLKTSFRGDCAAKELVKHTGKIVKMVGQLVTIKYVRTIKKELMYFGTFIDPNNDFFDTVLFPQQAKNYPFRGYGTYLILGKVVNEFEHASLETIKMAKLDQKPDPRSV